MNDIPGDFEPPRHESPGEAHQRLASTITEMLILADVHLSPRGSEALAVLMDEVLPQWKQAQARLDLVISFLQRLKI